MKFHLLCWLLKSERKPHVRAKWQRERKNSFNESPSRCLSMSYARQSKSRLLDNEKKSEVPFRSNIDCDGSLWAVGLEVQRSLKGGVLMQSSTKPTKAEMLDSSFWKWINGLWKSETIKVGSGKARCELGMFVSDAVLKLLLPKVSQLIRQTLHVISISNWYQVFTPKLLSLKPEPILIFHIAPILYSQPNESLFNLIRFSLELLLLPFISLSSPHHPKCTLTPLNAITTSSEMKVCFLPLSLLGLIEEDGEEENATTG